MSRYRRDELHLMCCKPAPTQSTARKGQRHLHGETGRDWKVLEGQADVVSGPPHFFPILFFAAGEQLGASPAPNHRGSEQGEASRQLAWSRGSRCKPESFPPAHTFPPCKPAVPSGVHLSVFAFILERFLPPQRLSTFFFCSFV